MSDTTLLSSMTERPDGIFTVINVSGDPPAAAVVGAVIGNYHRFTGREKVAVEQLEPMIGQKVTLLLKSENMLGAEALVAREGRVFMGSRGLGILPKGARSKGYSIQQDRLIDFAPGWQAAWMKQLVAETAAHFPPLVALTQDRLRELPTNSATCSLAVFGSNPNWGAVDCIWLINEYLPEDDIVSNVMLIRPEHAISEWGSCYGRELLNNRAIGAVRGFWPISVTEAMHLINVDFDEAMVQLFKRVK